MFRRKRRNRGTWFPNRGTFIGADPETSNIESGLELSLNVPGTADVPNIITQVVPLTNDFRISDDDFQQQGIRSLADILGHDWFLRRIVGKCIVLRRSIFPVDNAGDGLAYTFDTASAIAVAAGFFVGKANDQGSGGGSDTPIGSASAAEINDNYSPWELDTVRFPWIWRRTWFLGTRGGRFTTGASANPLPSSTYFPVCNTDYGSVLDGPHIDAKTRRRIAEGDRLWFALSAFSETLGGAESQGTQAQVVCHLDYRLFGNLRRPRNKGSF